MKNRRKTVSLLDAGVTTGWLNLPRCQNCLPDKCFAIILIFDFIGDDEIQLAFVAGLHRRFFDDHACNCADMLREASLGTVKYANIEALH